MSIAFPNLGIELDYVIKSFKVFGFEIAMYGVMIAVAMLLGISLIMREAKKTGQNADFYLDLSIITLVFAVVGARIFYVIFSWDDYKDNLLQIFNTRNGGLAIYGGIIAGVIVAVVFTRIKKQPVWRMLDTVTLGLVLGQIIGRWGNFFNREVFGNYSNGPLAMRLPVDAVRPGEITALMQSHLQTIDGVDYIQVAPTFLYEGLWNTALLILLLVYRKHKKVQGEIFFLYLIGYGVGRFWIEGIRTDQLWIPGTHIPVSQVLSVLLVLASILCIIVKRRKNTAEAVTEEMEEEKEQTTEES